MRKAGKQMIPLRLLLCLFAIALLTPACSNDGPRPPLRIAAWNLEHLDDTDAEGCAPREQADYDAIAARVRELALDIVALQEVENEAAVHRVFPRSDWHVEVSHRPDTGERRACWHQPGQRLGHLATGLAIRRGIAYHRNADLEALGEASSFQRWGTDVTVTAGGQDLRLLSVHLASGCWGVENDEAPRDDARRLHRASRPDQSTQGVGRCPTCRGVGLRHPGRFQPASGGSGRLGLANPVTTIRTAGTAHLGIDHPMQPPLHGTHRPPCPGRRRRGAAGAGLRA